MNAGHETRAEAVAEAMREAAADMGAPGIAWAVASGEGKDRQVTAGAAGGIAVDALMRIASVTKPVASAATLALVDDGVLGLDDPVERWVPEWGSRRVLARRHGDLAETVPASRPTTVRDLLMLGFGLGWDMTATEDDPLMQATVAAGITSTWQPPEIPPSQWAHQAAALPMAHQPGEGFMYHLSFDALTVVVEAVTGHGFDELLCNRILGPLGMKETAYTVTEASLGRVPANYFPDPSGAMFEVTPPADPSLLRRPEFCSASTGLVSTVGDLIRFGQMLLDGGLGPDGRVLSEEAVQLMSTDAIPPAAREMAGEFLEPGYGWGVGACVDDQGRFGWHGGTGTSLWVDPAGGVAAVVLTRQGMGSPAGAETIDRFWEAVRAAAW